MTASVSGEHCVAYRKRFRGCTNGHEYPRTFPPAVAPFTPNFTEALAGDCYTKSFLFASGKYLTPYSILTILTAPLPLVFLYISADLAPYIVLPYVRGAWVFGSLFFGTDRSGVTRSVSDILIEPFSSWDDYTEIRDVEKIRDTDSLKPLRPA